MPNDERLSIVHSPFFIPSFACSCAFCIVHRAFSVMLPHSYQLAGAIALTIGGLLACFAGYRLFRLVLTVYGFIFGAAMASSAMGTSNTAGMIVAALVGGVIGAAVLFLAYFVGVALVGAALGAAVAHIVWSGMATDPHPLFVVGLSILGAIGAMIVQRYVIVVGTALAGAWTLIVGVMALFGDRAAAAAAETGNVWILYPLDPAPGRRGLLLVWIILSLAGLATQLGVTAKARPKT
jgi:hypothetical protein